MKDIIKKILKEYAEEQKKVLTIPSLTYFNNDWDLLQKFLESKGNPKWKIMDDLDLENTSIEFLGNLTSVGGDLDLTNTPIKSLGNLQSVGGYLDLYGVPIQSLGNLTSVGGDLDLENTPISEKYTEEEIRQIVKVEGKVYL